MSVKEQLRQDWAARIADYKASGLTMAAWCEANHCKIDLLKYWFYKGKKPSSPTTSTAQPANWLPVNIPPSPSVTSLVVQVGHARVEVQPGFDPQLLRDVVKALDASC